MRRGMEERLCQDGFHDSQSWCAETALKVQVVAHCPTAEMWRTTVGECRFLFASCSKVVKWRHFCCSFMFDLIDLHFHSVLIYALCMIVFPIGNWKPENATWAMSLFLANTSKANDTSYFRCCNADSTFRVFPGDCFWTFTLFFESMQIIFLKSNAVFDQRLGGFGCIFSNQRVVFCRNKWIFEALCCETKALSCLATDVAWAWMDTLSQKQPGQVPSFAGTTWYCSGWLWWGPLRTFMLCDLFLSKFKKTLAGMHVTTRREVCPSLCVTHFYILLFTPYCQVNPCLSIVKRVGKLCKHDLYHVGGRNQQDIIVHPWL